ncbi:MAG: PadR family transcriptional regulator [Chloroflexota bacterium]
MPLEHAILALLEVQPSSGYNLKKCFDLSIGHFWSATQSHIYKALEGLERQGWASAQLIPQEGKPNRKEYHITEAGRIELHRWLATPLPLEAVRAAWLIQVFFAHNLSNDEICNLFEARLEAVRARLDVYRNEAQAALDENAGQVGVARVQRLWQLTLDYGVSFYQSELSWLEAALVELRHLPPLDSPLTRLPNL